MGKGDNSKKKHFLLFKQYCQKAYFPGSLKVGVVWKRVKGWFVCCTWHPFNLYHLLTDNIYIWPLTPCINYSIYLQITIKAFQLFISTTCINLLIIYSKIICLYLFKDYLSINLSIQLFIYLFCPLIALFMYLWLVKQKGIISELLTGLFNKW